MKNPLRLIAFATGILFFNVHLPAQDSLSIFPWKVTSKKISDGVYELIFSTQRVGGWLLYAPNQLAELETTELDFNDSNITKEGKFLETIQPGTFSNSLFGAVKGYDSAATWTTRIYFRDKDSVPALLQGKLLYTYGKEPDFFYPF